MTYLLIIFPLNAVPLSAKISTMYIPFDKEEMSTDAAESALKLHLTQTDSVEEIYRKMNE